MTVQDDRLTIDYRIRVIHTGLIVSWIALLTVGLWALRLTTDDQSRILVVFGGFFLALMLLTVVPWRRALGSWITDWLITVWCVGALLAQLAIELHVSHIPTTVGFLMVPFFAAATAIALRPALVVGVASVASYWIVLGESTGYVTAPSSTALLAFVGAIVFVMLISVRIRSQIQDSSTRYKELATRESELIGQEQELSRLYDASLAIGVGTKPNDVLSKLVGRVANSVGARIGLAMLYEPTNETLELVSPMSVSGHTVPADELVLTLDEPGLSQRVFMSGNAAASNDFDLDQETDRLAAELQVGRVAAVCLRIEDRIIGVLLVGDRETDFTDEDLGTLETVAASAALVLKQRTRYEQARMSSERMAELAQMKTDFVSVVSHELRTPLTSIMGALSTLKRPELLPDDPRAQQLIDMADKQSHRLRTLIEDLLVMSRLEATALPVRLANIEIDVFISELLESLSDAERVDVKVDPATRHLVTDPDLFARVVTNLVENALKYGGGSDIEIRTAGLRDEVYISVIDHGPGIPHEKYDLIFERFTQLQPHATRSTGGAGLGLSIVKGLAEAMGGRVWFEPTDGGGATFTVALPSDGALDEISSGEPV